MRVLALPRDPNPYQELLYSEMRRMDCQITYIGDLTCSHTLNLLLLPLEVAAHRLVGARLIHLHWVFSFALPGGRRFPFTRLLAYTWFLVWLRACRILGMRLVWTAHNVLPHEQVFADDMSARRALVKSSDLVLVHSQAALAELAAFGARVRKSAVIRHGPMVPVLPARSVRANGSDDGLRRFLFFGRIEAYKGVDDLIAAFAGLAGDVAARLTVAGQCSDPELRSRLHALARSAGARVTLRLERVPDEDVPLLLTAADAVVLPFRRVTTSGSAMLALSYSRPLIVPDLPGLADLPDQAVLRYEGGVPGLIEALGSLARADEDTLTAMSAAASRYASGITWHDIAGQTLVEMHSILGRATQARACRLTLRAP